jgi:uncharacterized integral membrane protein
MWQSAHHNISLFVGGLALLREAEEAICVCSAQQDAGAEPGLTHVAAVALSEATPSTLLLLLVLLLLLLQIVTGSYFTGPSMNPAVVSSISCVRLGGVLLLLLSTCRHMLDRRGVGA